MRSPVSRNALGECNPITSRGFGLACCRMWAIKLKFDLSCASTISIGFLSFYRNVRLTTIPSATQRPTLKPVVRTIPNRKFQLTLPRWRSEPAEKRHDSLATS
jgi:hypothetical protein